MNRICPIDVSSVLHAAVHSVGKARLSHNEQYTFVIYGFLFRLRTIVQKSLADDIVFAIDSKTSLRKQLYYSQYKENRDSSKKTEEQKKLDAIAKPQFDVVYKILKYIGYKNIFSAEGYEADDIIASVCLSNRNSEIVIVTSDKDMYQLLSNNCSILKPKDYRWYTKKMLFEEFGIEPKMWKRVKVYGGCTTDSVPGLPIPSNDPKKKVRHIGQGHALNYIKGKMNPTTNTYKSFFGDEAKRIVKRNQKLVILPFENTPTFIVRRDNELSRDRFIEVCKQYNFKSILEDIKDFTTILRLK